MPRKPTPTQTDTPADAARWRNRVVGSGIIEDASQLLANPHNFRIHSTHQQNTLTGVLDEVGWVDDVKVNQRTGFVVDGHMRVMLAIKHNQPVPVKYLDLSEEEEALILATFDPISAMAATDADKLRELLDIVSTGDEDVQRALAGLAEDAGIIPPDYKEAPTDFSEYGEDIDTEYCCPKCGYKWSGKPS